MDRVKLSREERAEILDIYAYLCQLEDLYKVRRGENNFLDDSNRFFCEDIAKKRLFLIKSYPSVFRNKVKISDIKHEIREHRYFGRSTDSKECKEYVKGVLKS